MSIDNSSPKRDAVRENILKIAQEIFSKFGYKKTTLDDIANAGVNLYLIFSEFQYQSRIMPTNTWEYYKFNNAGQSVLNWYMYNCGFSFNLQAGGSSSFSGSPNSSYPPKIYDYVDSFGNRWTNNNVVGRSRYLTTATPLTINNSSQTNVQSSAYENVYCITGGVAYSVVIADAAANYTGKKIYVFCVNVASTTVAITLSVGSFGTGSVTSLTAGKGMIITSNGTNFYSFLM